MSVSTAYTPDHIELCRHSTIHHGRQNERIYLMHLDTQDMPSILDDLYTLAKIHDYTKIVCKVPLSFKDTFSKKGYLEEAYIPNYFNAYETCSYMCYYLDSKRSIQPDIRQIAKVLKTALKKTSSTQLKPLPSTFTITRLNTEHISHMVQLFKKVFKSYPFPIFDETYLEKTMDENIIYFGLFDQSQLVGIASCETDLTTKTSEMTDFSIDPKYRGHNFALYLLQVMEQTMHDLNFKTLYTIARANSYGMNITFSKQGYQYGGTLKNNTHIAGQLESMNVWYKSI